MKTFRQSNLIQAWLVITLALVFGVSLAAIESRLSPVIKANKTRETMDRIPALTRGAVQNKGQTDQDLGKISITSRIIAVEKNKATKFYMVYDVATANGDIVGHVAKASGKGYADQIEILVGFDNRGKTISGLFVLAQKETPGLGNKIMDAQWLKQFVGKSTDAPLAVVRAAAGSYEIDGISGATISSRSVAQIVNSMVSDIRESLVLPEQTKQKSTREELL